MKTDIDASQDAAVADLVRAGQVRIGMFPPHYIKNATTGELKGWGVDLALALAARIGVEARPVEYPSPDKLLEGLNADACDAGFLVNSPVWANAQDPPDRVRPLCGGTTRSSRARKTGDLQLSRLYLHL